MQAFGLARIGRDAEVRYLTNGDAVVNLSLAFSFGKKGEDGKRQTAWVDGSMFGKRAEALAPYLLKGSTVAVTLDDVYIQNYTKQDGTPQSKMVGKIAQVDLAGSGSAPAPSPRQTPPPVARPTPASRAAPAPTSFDDMDDDIPFALSLNEYAIASSKGRRLGRSGF